MQLSEKFRGKAQQERRQVGTELADTWYSGYRQGRAEAMDLAARMAEQEEHGTGEGGDPGP